MLLLNHTTILNTIIVYVFIVAEGHAKTKRHKAVLISWEENHYIKELSKEDVPEDCQKIGICSNITIYDTQFVNKLLRKLALQKNFTRFNADQLTVIQSFNLGEIEKLCASKEEIVWPQAARDETGNWRYIVNTDAFRFQGYRIQRCIESGSRCSEAAIFKETDLCVQGISIRNMVYIDINNKQLATDYFEIPSCCSCKTQTDFIWL